MNRKQYSEIQHCLGVLEGLGTGLRGTAVDLFNNTLARLSGIINELAPEETKTSWEEAKAAWEKMQKEGVTVDAGNGTAISNCSTRYDPDTPSTPTTPLGWQNEYRRPANAET